MDNISAERLIDESKRRSVPGLHPGLNDLIRVLGKQAHCASRTLILCEPHIPSRTRKTNYHKHCSPERRSSAETVVRTSALWSPIRPDNYFYDCFNYTHYPERETDYLDIQKRYSALKNQYLNYSAPVCDENRIRRSLESPTLKHKLRKNHLIGPHPPATETTTNIADFISSTSGTPIKLMSSSDVMNSQNQSKIREVDEPVTHPVSTPNEAIRDDGESKSKSAPSAELIDLQNLIKKNDRENFERMQQMLMLMKELSSKDFCRATCDQVVERFHDTGKWKERGGNAVPPKVPVAKKPKPAAPESKKTTESKKSIISKLDDLESSDTESESDYLTENSTSSVTSSSGRSGNLHPVKSKSSTKVLETYSEESVEQDFIPFWHDEQEEGTSEIEENIEDRESSASLVNDAEVADVSAGSGIDISAAGFASPQSVDRLPVKMEANSTDSMPDSNDRSTESVGSTKQPEDFHPQEFNLIDEPNVGQVESVERDDSHPDSDRMKNPLLTVGDSPMTVHELVELSNIITDIVVLETVNELMKNGIYTPPSRRQGSRSITSPSMISKGTSEPPSQVQTYPRSIMSDSKDRIKDLKSVSLPRASTMESYKPAPKGEHELQPTQKISGTAKGVKEPSPGDSTSQGESLTSRGSKTADVVTTPSKTSGISKGAPRKSKMDGSKEAPPDLTTQIETVTSRGIREPGVPTAPSMTSGISKGAPRKTKMDGPKEPPTDALTTQREIVTSRGSREPGVPTTPSKTSGISKGAPRKSKMDGSRKAQPVDLTTQRETVTSRGSREPGVPTTPSNTSGLSDKSKVDFMKLNGTEGSLKSDIIKESRAESMESEAGQGLKIGAGRSNLDGEPRFESMKSKGADASEVGSKLSRIDEESTTSRSGDTPKIKSKKLGVSDQSRVGSKKIKGNDYANIDFHKPRVSKESENAWMKPRRSDEPKMDPVLSKTSLKRKSIEERIDPSKVSHVSKGSNRSEKSVRVGHKRTSSCRSPSPPSDRADKSYLSAVTSDKDKSKDVTSSSSVRSHKERRKLSGETTKLSTIDSICERDDSQTCFDYETDNTILYYVRITENAYPPEKETYRAAGFMLKSAYDYTIPPRGKVNVKTDLMLELPPNSYGRIAPVKCLAINFGIDVGADVINRDYRENVTVLLFNHSERPFPIKKGNKVAQLICESIHQAAAKEKCDLLNNLLNDE